MAVWPFMGEEGDTDFNPWPGAFVPYSLASLLPFATSLGLRGSCRGAVRLKITNRQSPEQDNAGKTTLLYRLKVSTRLQLYSSPLRSNLRK